MYVPTPGFRAQRPGDALHPRGGQAAVVLKLNERSVHVPTWYCGFTCSVLLLETLSVLDDVLVTGGGGARAQSVRLPAVTDPDIVAAIETGGSNARIPSPSSGDARWGAFVIVEYLESGWPYLARDLQHPAARASLRPIVDPPPFLGAGSWPAPASDDGLPVAADDEDLPEEIDGEEDIPYPSVPLAFASRVDEWREAFGVGWLTAAQFAWANGREPEIYVTDSEDDLDNIPPVDLPFLVLAGMEGTTRFGVEVGTKAGLAARVSSPPSADRPSGPAPDPDATEVDDDEADVDDGEDGAAIAAQTTGQDVVFEEHGVRVIVRETDGAVIVDARATAGKVRIQGGPGGVRVTAGGAIVDVDGGVVTLTGSVIAGSKDAEKAVALAPDVTAQLQALKTAINGAGTTPTDGGAAFKAALLAALSDWPGDVAATKLKAE